MIFLLAEKTHNSGNYSCKKFGKGLNGEKEWKVTHVQSIRLIFGPFGSSLLPFLAEDWVTVGFIRKVYVEEREMQRYLTFREEAVRTIPRVPPIHKLPNV